MQYNASSPPSSKRPFLLYDFHPPPPGAIINASVLNMDGSTFSCPISMMSAYFQESGPGLTVVNCSHTDDQMVAQHIRLIVDYSDLTQSNYSSDINFFTVQSSSFADTAEMFFNTVIPSISAFPMVKNAFIRATTCFGGRRVIRQSWKDVLGVGADYTEFSTYSHDNLIMDVPAMATYPDTASTLLLSPAVDFSNFEVQEDYRQHTTLAGLATVGGFFTIVDGTFAILFGITLFSVILGSKAISPFGALGLFMRQKLRRAIRDQYPALRGQIQEGGMATFLHDFAVDIDILDDDPDRDPRPSSGQYAGVVPLSPGSPGSPEFKNLYDSQSIHRLDGAVLRSC
ncbi:hypothetical protein JAAARDRAFT_52085 [Jaapia argillacea MUCL 33604]|uniref:Uncharacterized protein n=1 Tax=Jaapia argillacea MUCL 33604 TaxID=933084 RepID=A0A067QKP7_9AGAM|nr:hypothetical protein JAAARDRAFT_52085 [Jaapia argillacea MUCL 33604]